MSQCPHCLVAFHDSETQVLVTEDIEGRWFIDSSVCPNCKRSVLFLSHLAKVLTPLEGGGVKHENIFKSKILIRPKGISRSPIPVEVPDDIAQDYKESCLVLADSPKASAALSRRCLQSLSRDAAKVKHSNLANEIQEVLDRGTLPSHLAESIDSIRNIGNFAAHPTKSLHTGDIVPVDPGEAEWNLDVLEMLFDFYYVQPAIIAKKRAELNAKLETMGKPPMK